MSPEDTRDAAPSSTIPNGVVATVAGGGDDYGDGEPATLASIFPNSMAADSSGNLYIADTGNNAIRRVDAKSGIISTFAGKVGHFGYSGDGGRATAALLYSPSGVALDPSGNVYIADTASCVVRRVDIKTLIITRVAGLAPFAPPNSSFQCGIGGDDGPATDATLNHPQGVALDSAGNLFIADTGNSAIRRVDAQSGIITTIAGICDPYLLLCEGGFSGDGGPATLALLSNPAAVTLDADSDVYIADMNNSRIRRIDAETGIITTVAGTCAPSEYNICSSGYTPDGGLATKAVLDLPEGVAVDPFGNVIFSDTYNSLVRMVDAKTGVLSTIVGGSTASPYLSNVPAAGTYLYMPSQLAYDRAGNLYFAENGAYIRRVTGSTKPTASPPVFNHSGNAFDSPERVTFTDASPEATIHYTVDGSLPTTASTEYAGPITLTDTTTVEAFAASPGLANSPVIEQNYAHEVPAPAPVISPPSGTYTIPVQISFPLGSGNVPYAFYYTANGATPTTRSNIAAGGTTLIFTRSTVFKVFVVIAGWLPSPVKTIDYIIKLPGLPAPGISPGSGSFTKIKTVTMADSSPDTTILYTTDGTIPNPNVHPMRYLGPFSVTASTTVNAIATKFGFADSPVASAKYNVDLPSLPAPAFSLKPGTYPSTQLLNFADANQSAAIYYTLDGTKPTSASNSYAGAPVQIDETTRVKAIAVEAGYKNSAVTAAIYTIQFPPYGTIEPAARITSDSANLQGTVDPQGAAASYWFAYGTSKTALLHKTGDQPLAAGFEPVDVSAKLTSLRAKTTYFLQLVSNNAGGANSTAILSFTTH